MRTILSVLFITIFGFTFAQTRNFTLGILLPKVNSKINETSIIKLETKLTNLLNNSKTFSYGYSNDFVLQAIIDDTESGVVQGGLENINVIKLEVSFIIKQLSTGKNYGSFIKTFKGSGKNESQAIANSFSQINPTDKALHNFLLESKINIDNFYKENCTKIIQNANNIAKTGDYESSISLLQSIPDNNTCFKNAQEISISYYKQYQKKLCSINLTKAKSEIALNNFEKAVYYLDFIDYESECYKDALNLIDQISSKINRKEKEAMDLESKRINAIKEIGKAYYSNKVKSVIYL
jgi:hypothetical protein